MSMTTLGRKPSLKEKFLLGRGEEKPLLGHGENLLRHGVAEDEEGNLPLVVTLPITPRSRKSTKTEKDNKSV